MTTEEKELLFKDLSARLPYGTKMQVYFEDIGGCGYFDEVISSVDVESEYINDRWPDFIKPYLRPMSSMTEEENEEYNDLTDLMSDYDSTIEYIAAKISEWLNKHYFNYRGLIERKLALEAPEGMYGS